MRVWDVRTHEVIDIAPESSLTQAAEAMRRHHVGILVACASSSEDRMPVGVITGRDIVLSAIAPCLPLSATNVLDLMMSPVRSVLDTAGVFEAILAMRLYGIRRLQCSIPKAIG